MTKQKISYLCMGCMTQLSSKTDACKCRRPKAKKAISRKPRFEYEFVLWIGESVDCTNVEHYPINQIKRAITAYNESTRTDKHVTVYKNDLRTDTHDEYDITETLPHKKAEKARKAFYDLAGPLCSWHNQDHEEE